MHARLFTLQVNPGKMDEFVHAWHSTMLPNAQEQKGWRSGRLLVDRQTGKVVIVGMWDTEADALASSTGSAYAEKQRAALDDLVSAPPVIEHFELAGEA